MNLDTLKVVAALAMVTAMEVVGVIFIWSLIRALRNGISFSKLARQRVIPLFFVLAALTSNLWADMLLRRSQGGVLETLGYSLWIMWPLILPLDFGQLFGLSLSPEPLGQSYAFLVVAAASWCVVGSGLGSSVEWATRVLSERWRARRAKIQS